jgi:GNAT superfamily N-acetyltransferase
MYASFSSERIDLFMSVNRSEREGNVAYRIIPYQREYRDDMIYCLLLAKEAVTGKASRINEDLLDIRKSYFDRGEAFFLAVDDNDRVIGMLGTNTASPTDMWLKRLYVKPGAKRKGVGSALLSAVEEFAVARGIEVLHTRFSDDYTEAPRFYLSRGFADNGRSEGLRHMTKNIKI